MNISSRGRRLGLVCLAFVAAPVGLPGGGKTAHAQWLQWGGPHQNFTADAHSLASDWPENGPRTLWQRELGDGYSAILVDNGRLYTMYRADEQEIAICLDATTGKTVWEYKYDSSPAEGHVDQFGRGPRSTPLIDGDRLYTIGVSSKMHCLDKRTGKVHWSHDLWKEFDGNVLNHGYASSPIAYKDWIITLVGGEGASIVAFNKSDGSVAWKNQSFANSYSTPKVMSINGKEQLVTFMAKEIIGVDPNNGDLKWRYEIGNQWGQNVCMPIWNPKHGILFLSTLEGGARGLKLTPNGDKSDVEEVWNTRKIQFYHVTAISVGDYVFGSTGNGPSFFAAIDMRNGDVAWRKRGFAKATCVYGDGKLVILDEDGQLALTTASADDLKVHSKATVLEKVAWTVPTLVGKNMYVRDKKNIKALDLG